MSKLIKTFPLVMFITAFIQIFNMLKSVLLAKYNGISPDLDAFYLANIFTVTVFNVIGNALTTIVIPEFAIRDTVKKHKDAIESFITIINFITLIFITILFLILFFGKNIIISSFGPKEQALFLTVTFFLMIGQIFRIQTSISTAVLQSENNFVVPKFANLISAVVPIIYLLVDSSATVQMLSLWITISYIIETMIVLYYHYKKPIYRFRFTLKGFDKYTRDLLKNTIPIIFSSSIFQIQIIVINYLAAFFGAGYVTILSNTNQVVGIIQVLFISNIVSILYPNIARELRKNLQNGVNFVVKYTNITNILIIGMMWGYFVLGNELISILFVRGKFTVDNAKSVFVFGLFLIISLPFNVFRDYCYRIFYSLNKSKIVVLNSILVIVINIVLIFLLIPFFKIYSIVIAPLLGTIISTIRIYFKVIRLVAKINLSNFILVSFILNLDGFLMYFVIKLLKPIINNNSVVGFAFLIAVGVLFYTSVLVLFYFAKKKFSSPTHLL